MSLFDELSKFIAPGTADAVADKLDDALDRGLNTLGVKGSEFLLDLDNRLHEAERVASEWALTLHGLVSDAVDVLDELVDEPVDEAASQPFGGVLSEEELQRLREMVSEGLIDLKSKPEPKYQFEYNDPSYDPYRYGYHPL